MEDAQFVRSAWDNIRCGNWGMARVLLRYWSWYVFHFRRVPVAIFFFFSRECRILSKLLMCGSNMCLRLTQLWCNFISGHLKGLTPSMNTSWRLIFFLEKKITGECFVRRIWHLRSTSDMGLGNILAWRNVLHNLHYDIKTFIIPKWKLLDLVMSWFAWFRYHEANMWSGKPTYWQLTSLQAFWPGLQVYIFEWIT